MNNIKNIKYVICSFADYKVGEKLNEFFLKHTGKMVDFNSIKPNINEYRLLCFSIPLNNVNLINITSALHLNAMKFKNHIDKFIEWYENEYLLFSNLEIIKHIPHSSLELPPIYKGKEKIVFGKNFMIDNIKMSDIYVDKLFEDIDAIEVRAPYTRLYCDVEKYKDDSKEEMVKYGQGYIYTKNYKGQSYVRHLIFNGVDLDKDIDEYYDNHHNKLTEETRKILNKGKEVLILDIHSFSEEQAKSIGKEGPYPDVCIGINEHVNKDILNFIINKIEKLGYTYKINYPYSGSIIPNKLSDYEKSKVCSIMLEINKKIYL